MKGTETKVALLEAKEGVGPGHRGVPLVKGTETGVRPVHVDSAKQRHRGVPLVKGTETNKICDWVVAGYGHRGVPLVKGTETVTKKARGAGSTVGHRGVPRVKGTETMTDRGLRGDHGPQRCPPREGD